MSCYVLFRCLKSFLLFLKSIQVSVEEKEDDQKEHEKITTDECVSYGTLDNDSEIATKKDVRIVSIS